MRLTVKPLTGTKFPAIHELKALAIIIVVLSHARSVLPILSETLQGEVGVDIFLGLSGFLLAFSSTKESARMFLKKKAWRILPAYWVALISFVTIKTISLGAVQIESVGLHLFALHLFASPEYIYDINRSFWFVSFIAVAYLIFLAVRNRVERTGLMLTICGTLTLIMALWYQQLGYADGIMNIAPRFLPFFIGMIVGRAYRNEFIESKVDTLTLCGITLLAIAPLIGASYTNTIIAAAIILAWLCIRKFLGKTKRLLALLGLISYEIFLLHQPLIDELNIFAQKKMLGGMPSEGHLAAGVIAGIIVTIILSAGLHRITKNVIPST